MAPHEQAYMYAIGASMCFACGSLVFAHFAKKFSSAWMNFFKAIVCFSLMAVTLVAVGQWHAIPSLLIVGLMISGMIGLGVGDLFLLSAYARMGAGRTLILFGFQPLTLGLASWYFFNQEFSSLRFLAILFFILCLFLFSLEKYKEHGHWEVVGLLAALLGVLFDNAGVLLTRWAFEAQPQLQPLQANFIRCAGAVIFFVVANPFLKTGLIEKWKSLTRKQKWTVFTAAAMGTYLSLVLYVTALRIGHLASIAAIGVFGPLFSTALECAYHRRWPSRYLWAALVSFIVGFAILLSF